MPEESDRGLEQTTEVQVSETSAEAASDAVIGGQRQTEHQDIFQHAKTFDNQKSLSNPSLIAPLPGESPEEYKQRVEAIQLNSFGIVGALEPEDTGTLIASNSVPEQIAQLRIHNETGGAANDLPGEIELKGKPDLGEKAAEAVGLYSHRGQEDKWVDYKAVESAYKEFPVFERHRNIPADLISAMIRNEQHYYMDAKEGDAEKAILEGKGETVGGTKSIGPAQIQIRNIEHLLKEYPQLTDPELGGIDKADFMRDALKPDKSAWLATAYVADRMQVREAQGKPITIEALIQDYNPGGQQHYAHVIQQLHWIREHRR